MLMEGKDLVRYLGRVSMGLLDLFKSYGDYVQQDIRLVRMDRRPFQR